MQLTTPYTETTLQILKAGGWYEGRKVSPEPLQQALGEYEGEEFPMIESAVKLYQEMGGLKFSFYNSQAKHENIIGFDAEKATEYLFPGDVAEEYLPLSQSRHLIPVGYWNDSSRIMFIDEQSRLYLGADAFFELLGNTPAEALNRIFGNQVHIPSNEEIASIERTHIQAPPQPPKRVKKEGFFSGHNAQQAFQAAKKLLDEKKYTYTNIGEPRKESGFLIEETGEVIDVWVISYDQVVPNFDDNVSFIYLDDRDLELIHILTKYGYDY
ncbi:SUKH-3 domain-containing protein [Mucilaginibacter koreensis]